MAAEPAAVRAYLRGDMMVSGANLNDNTRVNALAENGLASWASFAELDDEEVVNLIKYVRRPGGDEDGVPIPATSISRIQVACYAARYYEMIGRAVNATTMEWNRIRHFKDLIAINKEYSEPEAIGPPVKNSKIVEWTESLEEYLGSVRGIRKVPLSYLIRENVDPGAAQAWPNGYNMPYSHIYSSFNEEMIARATHTHATYATDNEKLYQIISTALVDTPFMTSIKRHRSAKDGRRAFQDLVTHHSGTTKWNDLAAESDLKSTTTMWNGRSSRYTLTIHINNLRSFHNNLLRASEHTEYAIPTETQRVERLLKSLQTNEPAIISGVTTVRGSTDPDTGLYTDFERAADFILRIAPKSKSNTKEHNISGVQQDFDNVEKAISKGPKTGVELRYHTRKEFKELSKEEKDELMELRGSVKESNKRKGNNNNDDSSGPSKGSKNKFKNANKRMKKYTKKLKARIAALESERSGNGNDDQSSGGNTRNPLERPTQRN